MYELCIGALIITGGFLLLGAIRIIFEYERGVLFTLGKFSSVLDPGLRIVIPLVQTLAKVDTRIKTVDIPKQEVMTKDNVPVSINAVVYMRVIDPKKAV